MAMTDEEKMAYLDQLGTDQAREAEFARMKNPLKASVLKQAYQAHKGRKGYSFMDSLGLGAAQGATMNLGDEIQGGIQAGLGALLPESMGGYSADEDRTYGQRYAQERDIARRKNQLAQEAHGGAYLTGNIVGGLAPGVLVPGGVSTSLGRNAASAAVQGGVAGLGASEADDLSGMALDTALGAGLGGVSAPVGVGLSKLAGKAYGYVSKAVGKSAARHAANQSFKAAQPSLADFREIPEERAGEIGRRFLNEKVVRFGNSAAGVAKKTAAKRGEIGLEIGRYDDQLDALSDTVPLLKESGGIPPEWVGVGIVDDAQRVYPTAADRDLRELMKKEAFALEDTYGAPRSRGPQESGMDIIEKPTTTLPRLVENGRLPGLKRGPETESVYVAAPGQGYAEEAELDELAKFLRQSYLPETKMGGYDVQRLVRGLEEGEVPHKAWRAINKAYAEHNGFGAVRFSEVAEPASQRLTFKALRAEKSSNYRKGYETQDFQPTRRAGMYRQLAHSQGEQFDEFAEQVSPEIAGKVKGASARFRDFAEGDEVAQVSSARQRKQGTVTLTDLAAIGAAGGVGGPVAAGVVYGLKKVLEGRGHSMAAASLDTIAALAGNQDISGAVARAMLKNPERLAKYLPALVEAAGRSPEAFKAISEKLAGLPDF